MQVNNIQFPCENPPTAGMIVSASVSKKIESVYGAMTNFAIRRQLRAREGKGPSLPDMMLSASRKWA
jgi:hypothetical protein